MNSKKEFLRKVFESEIFFYDPRYDEFKEFYDEYCKKTGQKIRYPSYQIYRKVLHDKDIFGD